MAARRRAVLAEGGAHIAGVDAARKLSRVGILRHDPNAARRSLTHPDGARETLVAAHGTTPISAARIAPAASHASHVRGESRGRSRDEARRRRPGRVTGSPRAATT